MGTDTGLPSLGSIFTSQRTHWRLAVHDVLQFTVSDIFCGAALYHTSVAAPAAVEGLTTSQQCGPGPRSDVDLG